MSGRDPYHAGLVGADFYAAKRDVSGELAVVLQGKLDNRGLELIEPISRAVNRGEIHELILTDDPEATPGRRVDRIAYLGFFEVVQPGVILAGDEFFVDERPVGHLAGFDSTHLPNHLNVVIRVAERLDGVERGAAPGSRIRFTHSRSNRG
ncbi:MAG: hypothetical protein HYY09_07080 [Firmicutes bacterium]|nr:hypothetical protein [Bacillota bacterium]